jgi:hypothetical protein
VTDPLRQPQELLNLHRRPHPYNDLYDWVVAIAQGQGAILYNQRIIYELLANVDRKETAEMATLDDLTQAVADASTVDESIITLLDNIAAQLAAAQTDPAKIQAVIDTINAEKQRVADAVTANTPAAPTA